VFTNEVHPTRSRRGEGRGMPIYFLK
jgi:hypothetical protein